MSLFVVCAAWSKSIPTGIRIESSLRIIEAESEDESIGKYVSNCMCDEKLSGFQIVHTPCRLEIDNTNDTGWIRVEDRLPEVPQLKHKRIPESVNVLVTYEVMGKRFSTEVQFVRRVVRNVEICRFEWHFKICPWTVIAWMPLPEPYNAESKD